MVKLHPGEEKRSVTLRDDWITTDVRVGMFETLFDSRSHLKIPRRHCQYHWSFRNLGGYLYLHH